MPALLIANPALDAYEALAVAYDRFTTHHDHEIWLERLLGAASRHARLGRRALDAGCGTGKSFVPLLGRGFDVTACDLSPAMVEHARARHPAGAARVHVCDMRELPADWGPFDLVCALDDAVNYLLEPADLETTFAAAAEVLAPGGLYVFDVNTLRTYREVFGATFAQEAGGAFCCWQGHGGEVRPGGEYAATVEAFVEGAAGWERHTSRHVQRHHPRGEVTAALHAAGLELLEVLGQRTGAVLGPDADEGTASKLVYIARRGGDAAWRS